MFGYIQNLWRRIIKTGFQPKLSGLDRNALLILNGMSVLTMLICILFTIVFLETGVKNKYDALFGIPLYTAVLLANKNYRYIFSRYLFSFGSLLLVFYWSIENRRVGAEFALISLACTSALIFSKKLSIYLTMLASVLAYMTYKYFDITQPFIPDPAVNYEIISLSLLISCGIVVFVQILLFRDLTYHYAGVLGEKYTQLNETYEGQQQIQQQILNAKQHAEAANKAKSEFLANMSHEIRTPLNGVIGFTDLLKNTKLDNAQHQYVAAVTQSANSLLSIVNDILDFSKIESGKFELIEEKTALWQLGRQMMNLGKYNGNENELKMILSISPEVPEYILADELRLGQVLVNLVGNAIKFTRKGEVELSIEVITQNENNYNLRFAVKDSGIGIDPKNQQKIFEAFSQEDTSTTKTYGGTGLGLSISNKLLALMGSQLQLVSQPGKGSLFYFDVTFKSIPNQFKYQGNTMPLSANIKIKENVKMVSPKILIAEDNAVNMLLCKFFLKEILPNAEIIEANNGNEAVEYFLNKSPHLILMDVQMPEISGLDATGKIRQAETGIRVPIIALTAGVIKGEKENCLSAGMDDYISKPFVKATLEKMIDKWLKV
jgi:signal transduction histidine kinase